MELIIQEGDYLIKTLTAPEDLEEAYRLRHDVFCDELKWVPPSANGIEIDAYDSFSELLGVFDGRRTLVGHIRLTPSPQPFMAEKEFSCILPEGVRIAKGPKMTEITRLCVKREARMTRDPYSIPDMLSKGMYHWSLLMDMRILVVVVDRRCFRFLRSSTTLPLDPLGPFHTMPDGVSAAVCTISWDKFEAVSREKRPDYMEWMSERRLVKPTEVLTAAAMPRLPRREHVKHPAPHR